MKAVAPKHSIETKDEDQDSELEKQRRADTQRRIKNWKKSTEYQKLNEEVRK